MADPTPHPLATEHLPLFVSTPGSMDTFFVVVVVIATIASMTVGALYFTLHSLPERMAERVNSSQLQLVGVLCLLALFTHNNYFFFAALLLAAVRLPDWSAPLNSIARSLEKQSGKEE